MKTQFTWLISCEWSWQKWRIGRPLSLWGGGGPEPPKYLNLETCYQSFWCKKRFTPSRWESSNWVQLQEYELALGTLSAASWDSSSRPHICHIYRGFTLETHFTLSLWHSSTSTTLTAASHSLARPYPTIGCKFESFCPLPTSSQ
jgi:hypothetical protein